MGTVVVENEEEERGPSLERRLAKELYDGDGIGRLSTRAWNFRRLPDANTRMRSPPLPASLTRPPNWAMEHTLFLCYLQHEKTLPS